MTADRLEVTIQVEYPDFDLHADLRLPAHGVSALFGPSGSGKSTLLRAIAGLEPRARGRLALRGQCWQDCASAIHVPTHRRPLAMVFQDARLFEHLSVRANLEFGWKRIPAAERRIHPQDVVGLLGIEHLLDRRPATLSGGERQRAAIGRALLTSPQLLLLDEPLAALDEARKAELLPYLERLKRELSMPMIYVSHSMHEIARLADHLVVLKQGRVEAQGSVGEVTSRLDLPMSRELEASVVIEGTIAEHETAHRATRIHSAAGSLWVAALPHPAGQAVRLQLAARDLALAREVPVASSVQNVFRVRVLDRQDDGLGRSHFQVEAQGVRLLARITQRSADQLNLRPGDEVYAQVKGVAVLS